MSDANKHHEPNRQGTAADARAYSPSAARNREPILEAFRSVISTDARVLEVASGSGEHAVHICSALPQLSWQPSDIDDAALASVAGWREATGLANLAAPLRLDVTQAEWWSEAGGPFDAILSCNMIHIAPWAAAEGLVKGAGKLLRPNGALVIYGPFAKGGQHSAASNAQFDASLQGRNPEWGVRNFEDVAALAEGAGLAFDLEVSMPANNLMLLFRKDGK